MGIWGSHPICSSPYLLNPFHSRPASANRAFLGFQHPLNLPNRRWKEKNRRCAGQEKTLIKDPSLPNAAVVFLKEGATELTQAYSATPGSTNAFTWSAVTVVDGLDAMELRDATGRTIARGTFNAGLVEPA